MLAVKIKWKGHCAKHPKFNPEAHGRGGIRGGCRSCEALFVVYEASLSIKRMMKVCDDSVPPELPGEHALPS